MRTQTSWEDQQRAMDAARVLAEFANLEPDGVESFRADHPDFVPQAWWDYRPTSPNGNPSPKMQWQITQGFIRDAWLFEFQLEWTRYVHLLTCVFDPNEAEPPLFERPHRPPFVAGLDLAFQNSQESPYHLAVTWLGGQGWRAKPCLFCGKRFIAEHSKTKFCSFDVMVDKNFNIATHGLEVSCFWAHRKKEKAKNWSENSDRVNERRRQEYKKTKQKSERKSARTKTTR
jgi:hypothetical protein